MSAKGPLRWALDRLLDPEDREAFDSELEELHALRAGRRGKREADRWRRRQVRHAVRAVISERLRELGDGPRLPGALVSAASGWVADLRQAGRSLARSPALTATIVLTVGLGVGATAALYGVVEAVLLRPLPYAGPQELVRIYTDSPPNRWPFSVADYLALDAQQTTLEDVAGYTSAAMTLTGRGDAVRLQGRIVTWRYFSLLGLRPALGRSFVESDGLPGSEPRVVLSHAFWSRYLARDPGVVGDRIRLDGEDHTIVGVLPPDVGPLEQDRDFFAVARWDVPPRRGPFFVAAVARVADHRRGAAAEELRVINRRIFPVWQASYQDERASWGMIDLKEQLVGDASASLTTALGAVGLLLLIACTNAANLLLARTAQRRRELAVRAALGASRRRLLQHLLAEGALLGCGALIFGSAVATLGIELLARSGSGYLPGVGEIGVDGSLLRSLAVLSAASTLAFALASYLRVAAARTQSSLRPEARGASEGLRAGRLRRGLIAGQFAVTTPLLVAATLLAGSLYRLEGVDAGYESPNALTAALLLPTALYHDPADVDAFWKELEARLTAVPGVTGIAFSDGLPPDRVDNVNNFDLEDDPTPPGESQPAVPWLSVSEGYFELMGIPLLRGRAFDQRDADAGGDTPIVVDRAWAERFFPGGDALGERLLSGGCSPETCGYGVVVGVVGNVKYQGLDANDSGVVYAHISSRADDHPIPSLSKRFRYVVVRTSSSPRSLLPAVVRTVSELEPSVPVSRIATLDELMAATLDAPRKLSALVVAVGGVALLLSIVGVYGLMSYFVQSQRREIGIRLALGSRPGSVLWRVTGQGLALVALGTAVGLCASAALGRSLSGLLFEIQPLDPAVLGSVPAATLILALMACLPPARRAAAVDPALTLREE